MIYRALLAGWLMRLAMWVCLEEVLKLVAAVANQAIELQAKPKSKQEEVK